MILAQKYAPKKSTEDLGLQALIIGISYAACTFVSNGTKTMVKTGVVFNPAIALAQTTVQLGIDMEGDGRPLIRDRDDTFLWCYVLFPFLGAALAAWFMVKGHIPVLSEEEERKPSSNSAGKKSDKGRHGSLKDESIKEAPSQV